MGAYLGHYVPEELSLRTGDERSNCVAGHQSTTRFPLISDGGQYCAVKYVQALRMSKIRYFLPDPSELAITTMREEPEYTAVPT